MLNCVTPEILFHFWVETSLSSWTIYIKAKCIDIIFNPFFSYKTEFYVFRFLSSSSANAPNLGCL